jgi:Zn-dependent M28 family amino/carboxypeptidase
VERWAALHKAGAIGVATLANPRVAVPGGRGAGGDAATGGRGGRGPAPPAISLAEPALQETTGQAVAITINPRGAEKFFAGSGHTFEEIQKLASTNAPLPTFPLAATLRAKTVVKHDTLEAPNVVGLLSGSDSKLKSEYVVLSAHLDHVGVGRPVNGDSIYNGAMDDASGIATILEIARMMKESGAKPKRSVVFLAVTAEEKGELGSRYFAAHPTVAQDKIVADINLDMFLPLYPLKYIEVQGLAESTLGRTVAAAAKSLGVEVQADNEPEQNRFIRSDQYSFIRRGVPALAFKFGYAPGSPEEKIRRDWVRERYHRPSDDLDQPIDKAAAALFNRVILSLVERVADDPARPHWNDESFFRRFAK